MKKFVPYIIIVVLVIGGIGVYILNKKDNPKSSTESTTSSTDSKSVPAKKFTDACKVFTKEEIAAALGGTFGDGEEDIAFSTATPGTPDYDNEDLKGSACKFEQDDDGTTASMQQSISLGVEIKTFASADKAKTWTNDLYSPPTAEGQEAMNKPVDVKGVGDKAFFAKVNTEDTGLGEKVETLYVLSGRQIVVLTATKLSGIDHPAMQASMTDLAKKLN